MYIYICIYIYIFIYLSIYIDSHLLNVFHFTKHAQHFDCTLVCMHSR